MYMQNIYIYIYIYIYVHIYIYIYYILYALRDPADPSNICLVWC